MKPTPATLVLYRKMARLPFGRSLFSRAVCFRAPYFQSIKPRILELEPGHATIRMQKRRAVQNHIGTVHAIAMCNLAEFAAGLMTDVTVPTSHRWIPKGMTVKYLAKATSDLVAKAWLTDLDTWPDASEKSAHVEIMDKNQTIVATMIISMWVTRRSDSSVNPKI